MFSRHEPINKFLQINKQATIKKSSARRRHQAKERTRRDNKVEAVAQNLQRANKRIPTEYRGDEEKEDAILN